ncbi:MAG: hypothetical protein KF878_37030 [Planctomycetes bacterium]|nr:hypothetical protein [Planctomycetota bacterium]
MRVTADIVLPLRRLRLELDRTLRSRAFFARTAAGRLGRAEYRDLVLQLSSLVKALGADPDSELLALARADVDALDAPAPPTDRCPAVDLVAGVFRREPPRPWVADVALSVVGTSWTADAEPPLAQRFPRATALLDGLARRSRGSVDRIASTLAAAHGDELQRVYAFSELARGALLGLATYLDLTWPAPVTYEQLGPGAWIFAPPPELTFEPRPADDDS